MTLALFSPRIHGSRRFLFGQSLQPSELGKFAVIVWVAMLTVKKGDQLRHLTKGLLPFLLVIGLLDVLAVLEHGTVVEQGTHDELLTRSGRYAQLSGRRAAEADVA